MKKLISSIAGEIFAETGIAVELFLGGKVFYAPNGDPGIRADERRLTKSGGLYVADGHVWFFVNLNKRRLVGHVGGGEPNKNCALLIKKLLEQAFGKETAETSLPDSFAMLVLGRLKKAQLQQLKLSYPKQFDETYFCLNLTVQAKHSAQLMEYLRTLCLPSDIACAPNETNIVFFKAYDDSSEYQSAADFAYMLSDSIAEELGYHTVISVGGNCKGFPAFPAGYQNAMTGLRLGKILEPENKIYYYKDYLLVRLFEDLSEQEIRNYLDLSMENMNQEIFNDEEIMFTAEQFLINSLNISETARLLYLHRNTLIYRLDKLEKETGLNIRRFADATTFRMLRIITRLSKKQ